MKTNPYIMLVTREEVHPDNNMHYYTELKNGMALMEDGRRIPVDTEAKKWEIYRLFGIYDFDCNSNGYPLCTYAYVREDYKDTFLQKRGRGKTYFSILREIEEEITN